MTKTLSVMKKGLQTAVVTLTLLAVVIIAGYIPSVARTDAIDAPAMWNNN